MQANNANNPFAFVYLPPIVAGAQQNPNQAGNVPGVPAGPVANAAGQLGVQLAQAQPQLVAGHPGAEEEPHTPDNQPIVMPVNILNAPMAPQAPLAAFQPFHAAAAVLFPGAAGPLPFLPAALAPLPDPLDAILQGLAPIHAHQPQIGNAVGNAAIQANFFNQQQAQQPQAVAPQNSPPSAMSAQTAVYPGPR